MEHATKWPGVAKRKWLAGTVVFGLGVLLQLVHEYVRSILGLPTRAAELTLMLIGLAILSWGLVSSYHDSESHQENPKCEGKKL